jgi:hypothetical protein
VRPTIEIEESHRRFTPMFEDDGDAVGIGDVQVEGVIDRGGRRINGDRYGTERNGILVRKVRKVDFVGLNLLFDLLDR